MTVPSKRWLPPPAPDGCYRYSDGSAVYPAGHSRPDRPRFLAFWSDRTPLTGVSEATGVEERSYFDSAEDAAEALFDGGEGPARHLSPYALLPETSAVPGSDEARPERTTASDVNGAREVRVLLTPEELRLLSRVAEAGSSICKPYGTAHVQDAFPLRTWEKVARACRAATAPGAPNNLTTYEADTLPGRAGA